MFWNVVTGSVIGRIAVPSPRGEEVVAELGAGEWFGEMALITGEPRSASAIAAADTTLAVLARADFLEQVAQVPALGLALSHALSRRLRARLQGRPPRPAPNVVLAVTTAPNAGNTTLVANLAAALAAESDCPLAFLDHAAGVSAVAAGTYPGMKAVADRLTDLTALRAAHRPRARTRVDDRRTCSAARAGRPCHLGARRRRRARCGVGVDPIPRADRASHGNLLRAPGGGRARERDAGLERPRDHTARPFRAAELGRQGLARARPRRARAPSWPGS